MFSYESLRKQKEQLLAQPKKHTFLYGRRSEYFVQYFNLHKQQDGYKNINVL